MSKAKLITSLWTIVVWVAGTLVCALAQTDLPAGMVVADQFEPGLGLPVGKVQWARGEVHLVHQGGDKAFAAKPGLPVYQRDALLTAATGSTGCVLNDGSQFVLAPDARLVVEYSVYNAVQRQRRVDLFVISGRVRFRIKKLATATIQDFRVRTETATIRGLVSEFIVRATPNITEITALQNTVLEVTGLSDVEKTLQLTENQQTVVEKGGSPWVVMSVPAEEIQRLMQGLAFSPDRD